MSRQILKRLLPKVVPILLMLVLVEVIISPPHLIGEPPLTTQAQNGLAACDDLLFLMRRQITPDELLIGGGQLSSGVVQTGHLSGEDSGDIWTLSLNLLDTETQTSITLEFSNITVDVPLEFAVFWGMEPVPDTTGIAGFQPLTEGSFRFDGTRNGYYTIVVRLQHISQIADLGAGSYDLEVVYRPGANYSTALRDGERNVIRENAALLTDGRLEITFPFTNRASPTAYVHAGAVSAIGTIGGNAAQTWFINPSRRDNVESPGTIEINYAYSAAVATWGQRISYLAGDFSVTSTANMDESDNRRVFFLENFGYQADLRSVINLDRFVDNNVDSNGTSIRLNWDSISGFWMLDNCVGFHTLDGHEFIAVLDPDSPQPRSVVFGQFPEDACTPVTENGGEIDRYRISVTANTRTGEPAIHRLCLNWLGITPHDGSTLPEIIFDEGMFSLQLIGERLLHLEATDVTLARVDENAAEPAHNPLNIEILDHNITLTIDWRGLAQFDYLENRPIFTFLDDSVRTSTSRDGTNLARIEALQESIRLIYRAEGDSEGIIDRLILPARDGYAEILTPLSLPIFNTATTPDRSLFAPNVLNNVGSECYPINTMQPDANCPPNGHINPANGNLWYAVVDHQAYGYQLDLILARNYNSTQFGADGPFGYGWHTAFQLDYNVPYDSALNARPVTAEAANQYRLRLNLTWAPYGIVRFTSESGSQHLFTTADPLPDGDYFDGGILTTTTMPNWFLSRPNAHSNWVLTQADGLTYEFDRAGRLVSYGYPADQYPNYDRTVTVNRLSENELGHWSVDPASRQTDLIIITDAAEMRRLELYVDLTTHHITRSILRDMTDIDSASLDEHLLNQLSNQSDAIDTQCAAEENCFMIAYQYSDGFLREVTYPDGLTATYTYDGLGRLIGHDDPRAPISPSMEYRYFNSSGRVEQAAINFKGDRLAWQTRLVEEEAEIEAAALEYYDNVNSGGNLGEAFGRLTSALSLFEPLRIRDQLEAYVRQPDGLELIIGVLWDFKGQQTVTMFDEHTVQFQSSGGTVYTFPVSNDPLYTQTNSYTLTSINYANGYRVRYAWENGLIASEQVDQNGNDFRSDVIYTYHPQTTVIQQLTDATYPLFTTTRFPSSEFSPVPAWVFLPATVRWEDTTPQAYTYSVDGWLLTYTDENGAEYAYTWQPTHQWLQSVLRQNDGLLTTYTDYNGVGQVGTIVTQISTENDGEITHYTWDGLGRLTGIESSTLGAYNIAYEQLQCSSLASPCTTMRVTDPLNATTIYSFDGKGRLIETILYNGAESDSILRHTAYEYDDYTGRISAEIEYLYANTDELPQPLQTRYDYGTAFDDGEQVILDEAPQVDETDPTAQVPDIEVGYYISQTDAYGRYQTVIYDATDRIHQTIDEFGHITRYDYGYYGTQHPSGYYRQGLLIIQQDFYPTTTVQTEYYFNRRWQLNYIERDGLAWVFQPIESSTQLERLLMKTTTNPDSLIIGTWTYDDAGQIAALNARQMPTITLFDGDEAFNSPSLENEVDFLGRPTRITNGEGRVQQMAYCPLQNGETQVIQSPPLAEPIFDFDCSSSANALVVQYDAHRRITFIQDQFSLREFTYTANPELHEWQVTITTLQGEDSFIWVQRYNAAGDLVQSVDDSGIIRTYQHDSLGRLTRISVDEESSILPAISIYYDALEAVTNTTQRDEAYQELRLTLALPDIENVQPILETYTYVALEGLLTTIQDVKRTSPIDVETEILIASVQSIYSGSIAHDDVAILVSVFAAKPNPEASFTFEYNTANLLTQAVDDLGRGFAYTYNSFGQMTAVRNLRTSDTTTYVYTSTGLLRSVISPLGNNTTYLYDDTSTFDPTRLTQVIDATGGQHQYEWNDSRGTLTYTNPLGNQTVYYFDSFDLLWQITDAQGGTHEARYNSVGELTAWLRPNRATPTLSQAFNLDYSANGRQITISEDGTENWQWAFDRSGTGQIEAITSPTGLMTFGYDGLGRLTNLEAGSNSWSMTHTDGLPQISFSAQQDGNQDPSTLFTYDGLNRLVVGDNITYRYVYPRSTEGGYIGITNLRVQQNGDSYVYSFAPGNTSAFQSQPPEVILRATGQNIHYVYDTEGLLSRISVETCGSELDTTLAFFDLQSDIVRDSPDACLNSENGEIVSSTVQIRYDERGRLVSIADSDQNLEAFVYNDAGNLITYRNQIGQSFSYQYDALNRLTRLTSPGGIVLLLEYNILDRVTGICQTRLEPNNIIDYTQCVADGGLLEQYAYDDLSRLITQRFPNIDGEDGFSEITTTYNGTTVVWGDGPANQVELITDNPLSILDTLILSSGTTYTLDYSPDGQMQSVTGDGSLVFETSEDGNVEQITAHDALTFDYSNEANNHGFTITDDTGTVIGFILNDQGRLIGLNFNTEPLVEFVYDTNVGELLLTTSWVDAGSTTMRGIDTQAMNPSLISHNFEGRLTLIPLTNPLGQIQRQQAQGTETLFDNANGYSIVTSYDVGGRPLVMRIADADPANVTLLYTLAFTYDEFGRRQQETRQYNDPSATQIDVRYRYADENGEAFPNRDQLANRQVVVTTAGQPQVYDFDYSYDSRGNVSAVDLPSSEQICLLYEYDSAGRLSRVEMPPLDEEHTYEYDIFNRLVGIDEWKFVYHGATTLPFLATNGDTRIYYVQTADGISLFQADADGIHPLLHNGGPEILGDVTNLDTPLWLFDPIGRFISLSDPIPAVVESPCHLLYAESTLSRLAAPQSVFDNMMWDQHANLFFMDGRAYSPEIGAFLQRDPLGPDAFGNIYQYPSRQLQPPINYPTPAYTDGLTLYTDAIMTIDGTTALTAEAIRAQYYPQSPVQNATNLLNAIHQQSTRFTANIDQFSTLPTWLATNYNLPLGDINPISGALRWTTQKAPGQSGFNNSLIEAQIAPTDLWSVHSFISPTATTLTSLYADTSATLHHFTLYQASTWQYPATPLNQPSLISIPDLSVNITPNSIFSQLPHPLLSPENSFNTLETAQMLQDLPSISSQYIIDSALETALPQHPVLPPANIDALRDQRFTQDTLGIAVDLSQRFPTIFALTVPLPYLGIIPPNQ